MNYRILTCALAMGLMLAPFQAVFAGCEDDDDRITFSTGTPMAFATWLIPTISANMTIPPNGGAWSGTASVLSGTPTRGIYTIGRTGGGCNELTINITNISTGSAALTLNNFKGIYNNSVNINSFPVANLNRPDNTPFTLGATLTATSAVAEGNYTMTFDIVLGYN